MRTISSTRRWVPVWLIAATLAGCAAGHEETMRPAAAGAPHRSELIAVPNARVPLEGILTGGQPTREQLAGAAAAGYRTVINLRPDSEGGALEDEASIVSDLGMRYVHIPIAGAADLTDANIRLLTAELKRDDARPVLFHCASGNRVGALLALEAASADGKTAEEALALGKSAGLTRLEAATRRLLGLPDPPPPS